MFWCVGGALAAGTILYGWRNYGPTINGWFSLQTIERARESLGIHKEQFNIAFIGRGNTGRNTLINAITGKDSKTGNWEYGIKHESSCFPNCAFWEMQNCLNFTTNQYYNQHFLFHFDLIVVVSQATLGTDEIKLLKEAKKLNIPVILVRSKCEADLDNSFKFGKSSAINPEAANLSLKIISEKFHNDLVAAGLNDIKVFLVDAVIFQKVNEKLPYDFHFQEKEFLDFLKDKAATKTKTPS